MAERHSHLRRLLTSDPAKGVAAGGAILAAEVAGAVLVWRGIKRADRAQTQREKGLS